MPDKPTIKPLDHAITYSGGRVSQFTWYCICGARGPLYREKGPRTLAANLHLIHEGQPHEWPTWYKNMAGVYDDEA